MSVIKITVDDQNLHITDSPKIAAQGINENQVEFTFSADWDGYTKTAIFYNNLDPETVYPTLVNERGVALIPYEVTPDKCRIGLSVNGIKDGVVKTSEILTYKIVKGLHYVETSPPSPEIYEQILNAMSNAPLAVNNLSDMTNPVKTYMYQNHWYYYDPDLEGWIDGGQYGGLASDEQMETYIGAWLEDHPEATTTVQDGAITTPKLSTNLKNTIVPLSKFSGNSDEEKLYSALITDGFRGTILGGNIVIDTSIAIPSATIREVKIANAIITLNADMFVAQSDNFARLPSFVNCKFIGNGNAIYGSNYAVFGNFIGCSFVDCALINNVNGTVQSAYLAYCEVLNNTVSLIKANYIYDSRIVGMLCERQNATLIDTFDSTAEQGGPRNLWIVDSTFESFQSTVFKIACGGGSIYFQNCYFEGNIDGVMKLKRGTNGYDILSLEISGCKVNSSVTPFEISGFTNNYRVIISVHDNYYYTNNAGTPMITGVPIDNPFVFYNNRPSAPSDIISDTGRYIYEPNKQVFPTEDTTSITITAGGWVQIGRLVFVDMVFKAKITQPGTISSIITDFPKPSVSSVRLSIVNGSDGTSMSKELYITTAGVASLYGGITADERYSVRGFYFTNNKPVS